MKGQIDTVEDDFWTEYRELFTAQFPSYYTKPQKVRGRFHTSEEKYSASKYEIIPISEKQGNRTVTVQAVKTGITPQRALSARFREAKTAPRPPAGRLHMRR